MKDPQMKAFAGRLRRIDRIHRRGGGFEAAGTLGKFYYQSLKRRSGRSRLRPVVLALGMLIAFKATLLAHLDAGAYQARVETLRTGGTVEQAGAVVMSVDPLTQTLAGLIRPLMP